MIRTVDDAFAAGLAADCEHGVAPARCPACQLTPDEITSLAVLHRPHLQPNQGAQHIAQIA
ncbi:hypothetical protein ACFWZY_01725 [Streptomyces sp. NPDC058992]|uniref:hypothetical protein n=1 Tax=Streptomyces sp. NPDC058992 TaxID=3346688 RepID=UPI0036761758